MRLARRIGAANHALLHFARAASTVGSSARPHYECCEQSLRRGLRKVRYKVGVSDLYLCCLCSSVADPRLLADAKDRRHAAWAGAAGLRYLASLERFRH
jgi:hypothetical protein